MTQMVAGVVAACIVPNPFVAGIYVGKIGVSGLITVIAVRLLLVGIVALVWRCGFWAPAVRGRSSRRGRHLRLPMRLRGLLRKFRRTCDQQCSQCRYRYCRTHNLSSPRFAEA